MSAVRLKIDTSRNIYYVSVVNVIFKCFEWFIRKQWDYNAGRRLISLNIIAVYQIQTAIKNKIL